MRRNFSGRIRDGHPSQPPIPFRRPLSRKPIPAIAWGLPIFMIVALILAGIGFVQHLH